MRCLTEEKICGRIYDCIVSLLSPEKTGVQGAKKPAKPYGTPKNDFFESYRCLQTTRYGKDRSVPFPQLIIRL